jgi:predicted Zn-dependent protease with MMP-like domain
MDPAERERFDAIVEQEVALLPYTIQLLLQETPLLVEDEPSEEVLASFGLDASDADSICGLHAGVSLIDRSVEDQPELPETIVIYRTGILALAGGWDAHTDEDGAETGGGARIAEEITVTILHEVGHHFGLDEEDLDKLGFA